MALSARKRKIVAELWKTRKARYKPKNHNYIDGVKDCPPYGMSCGSDSRVFYVFPTKEAATIAWLVTRGVRDGL